MNRSFRTTRLASLVALLSLLAAFVAFPAPPAAAATIAVDTTDDPVGGGDCEVDGECSLREAVQVAAAGDTVTVPVGEYMLFGSNGSVEVSEGITIVGAGSGTDPADSTVLTGDLNNAGPLLLAATAGDLTLRDLAFASHSTTVDGSALKVEGAASVTLGNVTVDGVSSASGAVYVTDTDTVTIANSTFSGNTSLNDGGAVMLHEVGRDASENVAITVTDSTFSVNTSDWEGGAISIAGAGQDAAANVTTTITGSTFAGNAGRDGGGVHIDEMGGSSGGDVDFVFAGNAVEDNTAKIHGAGMYFKTFGDGADGTVTARFDDNAFVGNEADRNAGGLLLDRFDDGFAEVSFTGNAFVGNSAGNDGGGAEFEDIRALSMDTSVFDGNTAGRRGGAMMTDGLTSVSGEADDAAFTINRSAFVANASGDEAGASGTIVSNGSGLIVVANSTFLNNTSPDGAASVLGEFRSGMFHLDYVTMVGHDVPFDAGAGDPENTDDPGVVVTATNSAFDQITGCGEIDGANNLAGTDADCTGDIDAAGDLELTADASGEYLTPATTSPLVGAGTDCGAVDQLGTTRPATDCTVGAIETAGELVATAVLAFDCDDLVCVFDGTGSTGAEDAIMAWDWDFGDGTTSDVAAPVHTYGQADDYTVTLTVTEGGGQTDTTTATVTVTAATDPDPVDPDPVDPDPVDPDPTEPQPVALLECYVDADPGFDDVTASSTHADTIACAAAAELFAGYPDGTFGPAQAISRAQFASVMFRTLNLTGADLDGTASAFDDVHPGSTHANAIGALADTGVIAGFGDGTFGPDQPISRGQVTAMVVRAAVLIDRPFDAAAPDFSDVEADSTHAASIGALAEAGIVTGYPDGTFGPGGNITRGQTASMLTRWLTGLDA